MRPIRITYKRERRARKIDESNAMHVTVHPSLSRRVPAQPS